MLHDLAAALALKAAQAFALATTMSTLNVLIGATAEMNTSGVIPLVLAAEGKVMTRERSTVEFNVPQGTDDSFSFKLKEDLEHEPAVNAVVPLTPRHRHDEQPGVSSAEAEQQQPPRHTFVAQSNGDAQVSPGENVRHEPLCIEQVEQLRSADEGEQQNPPRQAPDVHDVSDEHE